MSDTAPASHSAAPDKLYPSYSVSSSAAAAALIYEIVWFQLFEFIIGSDRGLARGVAGTFMGGMPRQPCLRTHHSGLAPSAQGLCRPGLGIGLSAILIWYLLPSGDRSLREHRRQGIHRHLVQSAPVRGLPAGADGAHGRDAPVRSSLHRAHAAGRVLAGDTLYRQPRGRRARLPARRVLPAAAP